jgi:hypothetical protein
MFCAIVFNNHSRKIFAVNDARLVDHGYRAVADQMLQCAGQILEFDLYHNKLAGLETLLPRLRYPP